MREVNLSLIMGFALAGPLAAQAASDLQQRAQRAFAAQQWAEAAETYATLAKQTPDQPVPHLRLGIALVYLGRPAEAQPHLETAEKLGVAPSQTAFRLAQMHAAMGHADAAFAELKRATDARLFAVPVPVESDPILARIRDDKRFADFLTAVDRNARPCMHNPKHAEFDFWLGEWDVRPRTSPSNPPSTNVITKIHDGCVVLETYSSSPPGYTGQSFNIFDRTRQQWNQTWVDKMGGLHVYWGTARDGNLYYEGEMPDPTDPRQRIKTRLTFFRIAADTVRQFSESTRDEGKTWTVNYDLIYTRKK